MLKPKQEENISQADDIDRNINPWMCQYFWFITNQNLNVNFQRKLFVWCTNTYTFWLPKKRIQLQKQIQFKYKMVLTWWIFYCCVIFLKLFHQKKFSWKNSCLLLRTIKNKRIFNLFRFVRDQIMLVSFPFFWFVLLVSRRLLSD